MEHLTAGFFVCQHAVVGCEQQTRNWGICALQGPATPGSACRWSQSGTSRPRRMPRSFQSRCGTLSRPCCADCGAPERTTRLRMWSAGKSTRRGCGAGWGPAREGAGWAARRRAVIADCGAGHVDAQHHLLPEQWGHLPHPLRLPPRRHRRSALLPPLLACAEISSSPAPCGILEIWRICINTTWSDI